MVNLHLPSPFPAFANQAFSASPFKVFLLPLPQAGEGWGGGINTLKGLAFRAL